jgi:hypothetical protein
MAIQATNSLKPGLMQRYCILLVQHDEAVHNVSRKALLQHSCCGPGNCHRSLLLLLVLLACAAAAAAAVAADK